MDLLEAGYQEEEEKNERTGLWVTFTLHALLLLLFFAPFFSSITHSDTFQGILVNFGVPDDLGVEAIAEAQIPVAQTEATVAKEATAAKTANKKQEATSTKPVVKAAAPAVIDPAPIKSSTQNTSPVPAIADDQEKEAELKEQKAKKAAEKLAAEEKLAAQKKLAAEEKAAAAVAAKKAAAAAEQKKYEDSKKEFGDLFSKGKGNNNTDGDQGNPDGDPDARILDGLTTGLGEIGEGLENRNLIFEPEISDDSQKSGIVVVKICIDDTGKVTEAKFTQSGSTTTDAHLIKVAEAGARKYIFTPSKAEKQCGSVAVNFTLK